MSLPYHGLISTKITYYIEYGTQPILNQRNITNIVPTNKLVFFCIFFKNIILLSLEKHYMLYIFIIFREHIKIPEFDPKEIQVFS